MLSVVYWQPAGGLADRLGSNLKVGRHLTLCCIHCMNRVNYLNAFSIDLNAFSIVTAA